MKSKKEEAILLLKQELARRSLWQFCLYYDNEFFTKRNFLKEVSEALQEIEEGKLKSLAVCMPPRAGKSYMLSVFCAWTLGRNPTESVMRNTCTATLYLKFSYDVRAIVLSERYQEVFSTRLSFNKTNLQGWNTTESKQVGYFGAGVGGTIIGFGATKVGITDDLYKGLEEALSDTINDKIIQWKEATHDSRFESGCARVDVGTRWSINDVIGRNMEEKLYEKVIVIPALNSDNKSYCESAMTTEEYLEKKRRTPKEIWLAEYMQEPVDMKGRLFDRLETIELDEFEKVSTYYDNKQKVSRIDGCVGYVDVSDQGKDYTACVIAVLIDKKCYVVDYVYSKDNTDITIPLVASKLNEWNASYVRVESNAMGAMFARQLQNFTPTKVLQVHNSTNKITRIIMQAAFIMNNMIFVKSGTNEQIQLINNVLTFSKEGGNKNDDAPDSLAGLSIFVQSMFKF